MTDRPRNERRFDARRNDERRLDERRRLMSAAPATTALSLATAAGAADMSTGIIA